MDKMSGKSRVLPDKIDFWLFQPEKCPMSGAISRLDFSHFNTYELWKTLDLINSKFYRLFALDLITVTGKTEQGAENISEQSSSPFYCIIIPQI